jgi:hypothetical protein
MAGWLAVGGWLAAWLWLAGWLWLVGWLADRLAGYNYQTNTVRQASRQAGRLAGWSKLTGWLAGRQSVTAGLTGWLAVTAVTPASSLAGPAVAARLTGCWVAGKLPACALLAVAFHTTHLSARRRRHVLHGEGLAARPCSQRIYEQRDTPPTGGRAKNAEEPTRTQPTLATRMAFSICLWGYLGDLGARCKIFGHWETMRSQKPPPPRSKPQPAHAQAGRWLISLLMNSRFTGVLCTLKTH